jgi:hypothetical protein
MTLSEIRRKLGNIVDLAGTGLGAIRAPELGISELIAGGNTNRTGQKPQYQTATNNLLDRVYGSPTGVQAGQVTLGEMQGPAYPGNNTTMAGIPQDNGFDAGVADAGTGLTGSGSGEAQLTPQQLMEIRDAYLAQIRQAAQTQGSQGALQYAQQLQELDQAIADNLSEAQGYVQSYNKNINAFRDSKDLGDVNRQGYFSGLSPNAFQSSQATSQDFANNKYAEGLGDYFSQAEDAVGSGFLSNPNDASQLSATSQFGRQRAGIGQDRSGLESSYNAFTGGLQDYIASAENGANAYIASGGQGNIGEYGQPGSFNYVPGQRKQVTPGQVDLSGITPYTSFQSLSSVPQSGGGGYGKVLNPTNPFKDQSTVDQYLGKTNTGLNQGGIDYLKKYLAGSY